MPNAITLAQQFVPLLDEVYQLASLTADLDGNPDLVRQGANAKAIAAAKSALGIHSPSRVFMEIGDQTVDGLTIGLKKNTKHAADAAAMTAASVTDSFYSNYMAGPEAIAPIDVLQDYVSEAVADSMAVYTEKLRDVVESEAEAVSARLEGKANPGDGDVTNNYGGTTINVYMASGSADTAQRARDIGREIGAETAREMRRRGLVPA